MTIDAELPTSGRQAWRLGLLALLRAALTVNGLSRDLSAAAVGIRHWDGNAKREYPI